MTVQNLSAQASFITKDGSAIRSILDRTNAPVQNQSLAEARVPAGGRTERHHHKVAEEALFHPRGRGRDRTRWRTSNSAARAMRSSSPREPGTRSWLQNRYAFSVAGASLCAASNSLRNFGVRRVPILRLRLDCQINGLFVVPADPLKAANIDFTDSFQPTFGRFSEGIPEHVPMFGERDDSQTTYGYVLASEEARRVGSPSHLSVKIGRTMSSSAAMGIDQAARRLRGLLLRWRAQNLRAAALR